MSLILINSPGLATSNSYASLATAGLYIEENVHISAIWASLSTQNRTNSIIYATTLLDTQMTWIGSKGSSVQALEWPRDNVYDENGYIVTNSDIPKDIQRGCAFYAYELSQSDRTAENDTLGFSRLDAGSLRMDIDKYDRRETMPTNVYDLIKYYGARATSRSRVLIRR